MDAEGVRVYSVLITRGSSCSISLYKLRPRQCDDVFVFLFLSPFCHDLTPAPSIFHHLIPFIVPGIPAAAAVYTVYIYHRNNNPSILHGVGDSEGERRRGRTTDIETHIQEKREGATVCESRVCRRVKSANTHA